MISIDYCKTFARYNRWQNQSLYAAAATLPDGTRKRNMGAFFKSIHGTLNHLLVADRLWLDRLEGHPSTITSLNEELYNDFEELTRQRSGCDDRLDRLVASLTDATLAGSLTYRRMSGDKSEMTLPMATVMMQVFNHQTHHRGQVSTLLMQCGVDVGVTDLPMLPPTFLSPVFGK
jgi:uncharacterized damage-inducible protein DinB